MRKGLLLLPLAFAIFVAKADVQSGTPVYTWTNPINWSDGSPLAAAQITGYQLSCTGAATVSRRITPATGVPPFPTPVSERYAPGSYTCTMQVYAKYTPTSPEDISAMSNSTSFTVPRPTLGAPTGFSAN